MTVDSIDRRRRLVRTYRTSLARMWSSSNFWRYRSLVPQLEAEEDAGRGALRPGPPTHS
jgi:hypothetical protein